MGPFNRFRFLYDYICEKLYSVTLVIIENNCRSLIKRDVIVDLVSFECNYFPRIVWCFKYS